MSFKLICVVLILSLFFQSGCNNLVTIPKDPEYLYDSPHELHVILEDSTKYIVKRNHYYAGEDTLYFTIGESREWYKLDTLKFAYQDIKHITSLALLDGVNTTVALPKNENYLFNWSNNITVILLDSTEYNIDYGNFEAEEDTLFYYRSTFLGRDSDIIKFAYKDINSIQIEMLDATIPILGGLLVVALIIWLIAKYDPLEEMRKNNN